MQYYEPQPEYPVIVIEKAGIDHIQEVAEFMALSNQDTYAEPLGLEPEVFQTVDYRNQLEDYVSEQITLFDSDLRIVALNGLVVGMIGARPDTSTVHIWGNRVATKHQGQHIGLLLMEIITDNAREQGVKNISADVNTLTAKPTEFYEKLLMTGAKSQRQMSQILPEEAGEQKYKLKSGNTVQVNERVRALMRGTTELTLV